MSIEIMRYVWNHSKSKSNNRLMLLALADIANDSGDAYPGVDRLATKCNTSHRTAQDCIQELERMGELQVFESVGTRTKSGWTNLYRVVLDGIKQSEVRAPDGSIASPRAITDKKPRSFPKAMQLVAPLSNSHKDVQLDSPLDGEGVQLSAPDGVQLSAPNSSVYPPESNTNTNTSANAETVKASGTSIVEEKESAVNQATEYVNTVKPRNLEMDAVTTAFKINPGAYAQLLLKQLKGDKTSKGKRLEYLITPPMPAAEILACRDWYGTDPRYKDKGALPQTAETIYERVLEFRAQPDYDRYMQRVMDLQTTVAPAPEPTKELPPANPEYAARAEEIIQRMARGESIHDLITS